MNSRERVLCAAKGGKPDVVPAMPYIGNYGAALMNVPISAYNTNGRNMAEAQLKAWEILKLDTVVAQSDNYYLAESFGCEIHQPYNKTPHVTKYIMERLEDVDKLRPIDPYAGRAGIYHEAVSILKKELGGEVAVRGCGTGCFSLAGHLMGMQQFIMEMVNAEAEEDTERQGMLHQLMEMTSDALIAFITANVEAGGDFAVCGDSAASLDLISPMIYDKYVFPYEQKVFKAVTPVCEKYGAVKLLHICGNTTRILPKMAITGADIIEIDHKVDLVKAREIVGDKVCILGNLEPVGVIMQGSVDKVKAESQKAIDAAGKNGAFLLGSGCEVAVQTPPENIIAMREVAHSNAY